MKRRVWRIIKWSSLIISAGSVIGAILLMWMQGPTELASTTDDQEQAQTRVERPFIIERKDGQIVWQLRAKEAKQQLDGRMHLSMPLVVLFTKDGREIPIESRQAWLDPIKRNIHFQGDVIVHYESWDLFTEVLIYENSRDEMHIPKTFRIKGETLRAHGEDLRLHRQTGVLTVDKGIWIEDSNVSLEGVIP